MTMTVTTVSQTRLREEVKQKWIEELESGNWKQGQGKLGIAGTNHRCCLGVLCEIAAREDVIPKPPHNIRGSILAYAGSVNYLPLAVIRWAFESHSIDWASEENPRLKFTKEELQAFGVAGGLAARPIGEDGKVTLAASGANDGGVPFTAIANAIRRTL